MSGIRWACARIHRGALGLLAPLLLLLLASAALAQSPVPIAAEYDKLIKSRTTIAPLGSDLFGDQVNLYDGSLQFRQTDIDLPGNSALSVSVSRSFKPKQEEGVEGLFADWEFEIPRLQGVFSSQGWIVMGSAPQARCSQYNRPPATTGTGGVPFDAEEFWAGNFLVLPGRSGGGEILKRSTSTVPAPTDGQSYPLLTRDGVVLRCLGSLSNGSGEGFEAVTPDGTRYRFDHMASRIVPRLSKEGITLPRLEVWIMPTLVTDRWGNATSYSWNASDPWKLDSINANDGRVLAFAYAPGTRLISSITDGAQRMWTYTYAAVTGGQRLSQITQPDGSRWTFNLESLRTMMRENTGAGCADAGATTVPNGTGTMTHPSGAQASFSVSQRQHGRSHVHLDCRDYDFVGGNPGYAYEPATFLVPSIVSKTLSGPGIASQTWSYSYGPTNGCYDPGINWPEIARCSGSVTTTKTVSVTAPDGAVTRYTFGNHYRVNEGQLLQIDEGWNGTTALRTTVNTYASPNLGPYSSPAGFGIHPRNDSYLLSRFTPLSSRVITQQGATFSWTANTFDAFARPLSVTRSSSTGPTRTDVTSYYDHFGKWVLGQIQSVTNNNTGLVQSRAVYDQTHGAPTEIYAFGKKLQTLSYHAHGNVHTAADGRGNTTTLTEWERGIPRHIRYADNTTQTAVLDSNGWIASITDQNGFTTSYSHDTMGRLSGITHPTSDDVAWNPTTWMFDQVAASEYGIPSGHWRRTESTGNARKITYFDALWRPVVTTEYDTANPGGTRRFQRFAYDHDNRTTFASYPGTSDVLTTGTHTSYDALGRTTSVSQNSELGSLTTATEYLSGFRVRVTNPRLHVTLTGYRAYDTPNYELPAWVSHPEGAYTDIAHDVFGKPLSITRRDATSSKSITRRYVYDPASQQLCKTIEPETGATVMDYDDAGNLAWSAAGLNLPSTSSCDRATAQASGRAVARTYNAMNRIDTLSFPDARGNQVWLYTPDGLPVTVTTSNAPGASPVTNQYIYNKRRLLRFETLSQSGAVSRRLGYAYDANGALATITYPTALIVSYAPNALGQATQAGSYASGVTYHPNGAIQQFTYGNGIVHTMTQNARQLPEQVVDSGNVLSNTYTYDPNANVQQIADAITANNTRVMGYDGLDRLTSTLSAGFGGDGNMSYTYDELDNLRSARLAGVKQYNYGYDTTNRLTSITNDAGNSLFGLSYDLQGNVSSKNALGFTFDFGNRLRESDSNGALVESYEYDAHGRRVNAWSAVDGNIRSVYGTDGVLRHQIDDRAGKFIDYVYLGGSLVARVSTPVPPPGIAPDLSASSAGGGTYSVSWTSVMFAGSYQLEESFNGGAWTSAHAGPQLTKSFAGRPSGTYAYRVKGCNVVGCGPVSATRTVTVDNTPGSAPSAPATPTVPANNTTGSYSVSWSVVATATSYRLEESVNGGAWAEIFNAAGTSASLSGRVTGTYTYRARACNAIGCGPYSGVATTQVLLAPGAAPVVSVPATSYTGSYSVTWTSVADASSYLLEESANGGAWTEIQNAASTSRAISGKSTGTYSYRARACNASGCGSYSSAASIQVTLPPATPSLSVPASSTGGYSVSWTSVANATSYPLEESVNGGAWTEIQNSSSTSISFTSRANGTYGYRVRACNVAGCGSYSATQSTTVLHVPAVPANLSVTTTPVGSNYQYTATWSSVSGATSYEFNGGGRSYAGPNTSYQWSEPQVNADPDIEYYVRACNASGCSGWRGPAYSQAPAGSAVVSVPSSSNTGSYTVSWTSVAYASTYRLEESANGGAWTELQTSASTSLAISGRAAGTYAYRVLACNTSACSSYSNAASIQVTLAPTGVPSLSVPSSSSTGSYSVSWTTVANATSYRLEESVNGVGWTQLQNAASTSMALSGRGAGTYTYRVRACNSAGCGGYSATQSITVTNPIPSVPTSLGISKQPIGGNFRFTATWSSSAGATSYEFNGGGRSYTGPNTSFVWTEPQVDFDPSIPYYVRACNSVGCSEYRGPSYAP